jgi:hypothetical protein
MHRGLPWCGGDSGSSTNISHLTLYPTGGHLTPLIQFPLLLGALHEIV